MFEHVSCFMHGLTKTLSLRTFVEAVTVTDTENYI